MRPINFFFFCWISSIHWLFYLGDLWYRQLNLNGIWTIITQNTSFKISLVSAYFYNVKQGNLRYILLLHFYNSNMHRLILPSWKKFSCHWVFFFQMSEWMEWSNCERNCNGGKQARFREVLQAPQCKGAGCTSSEVWHQMELF